MVKKKKRKKKLLIMQETQVRSLSQEDPSPGDSYLECSCLTIPWTEDPGGLQSMLSQRVIHN